MAGFWLTLLIFVPTLGAFDVLLQSDEESIWRSAFMRAFSMRFISFWRFLNVVVI